MLLKEKVTDTTFGPVRAEAGAPLYVEDFHPLADSFDDGFLGRLKCCLELGGPREFAAGAEKRLERGHGVAQLGVVGNLVDEAKPTPDVSGASRGGEVFYGV